MMDIQYIVENELFEKWGNRYVETHWKHVRLEEAQKLPPLNKTPKS